MAENNHPQKPLKLVESIGKAFLTGFLERLVQNDVLKFKEEDTKKFNEAEPGDKRRIFLDSLRNRGEEAGRVFFQTFWNLNDDTTSAEDHQENESGPEESTASTDTLRHCAPEDFQRMCTKRAGEIYPIRERNDRTRLALIICNKEFDNLPVRSRADNDIAGMQELLEGLDYTVEVKVNLTATEMKSVLQEFARQPKHKSSDSTFLVFMSHGTPHGIWGTSHSDESPDVLPYDTIFKLFNSCNCSSLRNKPKVIIVQACTAENPEEEWSRPPAAALEDSPSPSRRNLEVDAVYKTHVEKDFIAFCSLTPYSESCRETTATGSVFIKQLITCFQKYSWCWHIQQIFREVQRKCEIPNVESVIPTIGRTSLTRKFYLFPGN